MADEINLQFMVEQPAASLMAGWRDQPPEPMKGFEIEDQAVDTLMYKREFQDASMRLMNIVSFGMNKLWGGDTKGIYRLSVKFDPEGDARSRVTIVGTAPEDARAALGAYAAERGTVMRAGGVPATGP